MKRGNVTKSDSVFISKGSVFADLGFPKHKTMALRVKADLFMELLGAAKLYKLSQRDLQRILDQPQPRISELLNGKISKVSIEKLLDYLGRLGVSASVSVSVPKRAAFKKIA